MFHYQRVYIDYVQIPKPHYQNSKPVCQLKLQNTYAMIFVAFSAISCHFCPSRCHDASRPVARTLHLCPLNLGISMEWGLPKNDGIRKCLLVVAPPLWKIWKSVGSFFPIYGKTCTKPQTRVACLQWPIMKNNGAPIMNLHLKVSWNGVPLVLIHFKSCINRIFHYTPSIYWGYPHWRNPPNLVRLVLGETKVGQARVTPHAVQQDVATSFGTKTGGVGAWKRWWTSGFMKGNYEDLRWFNYLQLGTIAI